MNTADVKLLIIGPNGVGKTCMASSLTRSPLLNRSDEQNVFDQNFPHISVVDVFENLKYNGSKNETLLLMAENIEEELKIDDGTQSLFLLVFNVMERFTESSRNMMTHFKNCLGENFLKYCIVALSFGDQFDEEDFETWCQEQQGSFQDLLRECQHRVILFSSKIRNETNEKEQIEELFKQLSKIQHLGYTLEEFRFNQGKRELLIHLPSIEQKFSEKMHQILNKLKTVTKEKDLYAISSSHRRLIQDIKERDKGFQVLTEVLTTVNETIEREIEYTRRNLKSSKTVYDSDEEMMEEFGQDNRGTYPCSKRRSPDRDMVSQYGECIDEMALKREIKRLFEELFDKRDRSVLEEINRAGIEENAKRRLVAAIHRRGVEDKHRSGQDIDRHVQTIWRRFEENRGKAKGNSSLCSLM